MENFNVYIHVDREGFSQRAQNDWREDDGGDDGDCDLQRGYMVKSCSWAAPASQARPKAPTVVGKSGFPAPPSQQYRCMFTFVVHYVMMDWLPKAGCVVVRVLGTLHISAAAHHTSL